MGYYLSAFIGKQQPLQLIVDNFSTAKQIHVGNDIFIIPMTEDLYDEINNFLVSDDIGGLTYMTENIEAAILKIIGDECVGYVEAEYFGDRVVKQLYCGTKEKEVKSLISVKVL